MKKTDLHISSVLLYLATMVLAAGCSAQPVSSGVASVQSGSAATFDRSAYIDRDKEYFGDYSLLPAPAMRGSEQEQQDLEVVLKLQDARTPADVERINKSRNVGISDFAPVIGPWFTAKNLPKTHTFMAKYLHSLWACSVELDDHFVRLPPYSIDARVKPAVLIDYACFSYPCADAAYGRGVALLLSDLFPDLREPLLKRGNDIGWDRVISGEKFPSDIAAGRSLADHLYAKAIEQPEFTHELQEVRAELKKARTPSAAK